ncbi:cysteine-rich receptor-like protein kinase 8 [Tanacetum coccineum]
MAEPTPLALFQNPLYLHPFDGPSSLTVQEKLVGAQNYRAWRIAIEIGLSTKRKLGFIKGTVVCSTIDDNLAELWDTCNNMQMNPFTSAEEETDHQFVAGTTRLSSQIDKLEVLDNWIYDTRACDHMTPVHDSIFDPYQLKIKPHIRLPNGDTSVISHVGKVKLNNRILLKDVLVVPSFKFSMLKVTGLGSMKEGLYHLVNVTHDKIDSVFSKLVQDSMQKFSLSALGNLRFENKGAKDSYGLWHHRLGHVSDTKLKCMNDLPVLIIACLVPWKSLLSFHIL